LCQNCHAEVHHELGEQVRTSRMQIRAKRLGTKSCRHCHATFRPKKGTARYCSQRCYRVHSRKVTRPSVRQLSRDLSRMSWSAVGEKYGVSDNAVRKWARQYGIMDR
jgi:hypothetical protein